MAHFIKLLAKCNEVSAISAIVIDEFLISYTAEREPPDREMEKRLSSLRKVTKDFSPSWSNMIKAQYIGHRVFADSCRGKSCRGH